METNNREKKASFGFTRHLRDKREDYTSAVEMPAVFCDEPHSPECLRFYDVVNEKAMRVKASGEDLWRVSAD